MRIGMVSDCYVPRLGGIEMQVHDLSVQLQAAGHEVVVLTPTPGPEEVDGVRVHRMQVPLLPFDIPYTRETFELVRDLLAAEHVDVAHFHGGILSPLAFGAASNAADAGIPSVITTHCLWSYATPAFQLLNRRYHWADWPVVLSAVSDVAAVPIRKVAGASAEVTILPNGINRADWVVTPAPRDASVVTVVSVMRLAPRKRPMHLMKMLRRVHEQLPPGVELRAVIIGEGPERSSMERYLAKHHLGRIVELTGRLTREEIRDQFSRADIFVAPANLESFGIAALEARSAGLPVIAKARTGIREFIAHGQEGLLAESDDDMVAQLVRLIRDAPLRNQMAEHNRATAPPVAWEQVVEMNLAAYRSAIELVRSSRPPSTGRAEEPPPAGTATG